jgi:hypothetical protein
MFRLDHHCPWWSGAPGGQGVTAAVGDPPLARIRLWWGVFRAQAAHGAYAVTISNGLCDHTRAMPRPEANIVRACVCVTLRTELATFSRTAATLPAATARAWIRTGDRADYESGFGFPCMSMVVYLRGTGDFGQPYGFTP